MEDNIVTVSESNFDQTVLRSDMPVLVDFWAVWCGPCQMIAPALENLAEKFKDRMIVAKLNIDENMPIASKYGVMSIPTLLLFKDGEVKEKLIGAMPEDRISRSIEKYL